MFRTVSVHLQDQSFYKLYVAFGICPVYADTSGCCVAVATQQPDVLYRHIPNTTYSLKNIAPEDGLIQSETCRAYIEK